MTSVQEIESGFSKSELMSAKTFDITSRLSAVLVGLDDTEAAACKRALDPIRCARADAVSAREMIPETRPLVVVVGPLSPTAMAQMRDLCRICVAELVTRDDIPMDDPVALSKRLLAAVRVAESRRM
jgi:hypothetical protein